jgi:hypothetical protein
VTVIEIPSGYHDGGGGGSLERRDDVGVTTCYRLKGLRIELCRWRDFPQRLNRPRGPTSILYGGWSFPGLVLATRPLLIAPRLKSGGTRLLPLCAVTAGYSVKFTVIMETPGVLKTSVYPTTWCQVPVDRRRHQNGRP